MNCSNEELLLYYDQLSRVAYWAILCTVGCPPLPPDTRECLRICASCHSHAVHIQVENRMKERRQYEMDGLNNIVKSYERLNTIKPDLLKVFSRYEKIVYAIKEENDLNAILAKGESTTKVLAKYNSDTSDMFIQFAIDMQNFKTTRPRTISQVRLVKSIVKASHDYYSKHFYAFRDLQRSLDHIVGYRILENVQFHVDCQTINCTFLALKQSGLECLHICNKYQIKSNIASLLAFCEDTSMKDLKKIVESSGQNWEEHERNTQKFIKDRLERQLFLLIPVKDKKTELIKISLRKKCDLLLLKVERQLIAKASVNQFLLTKNSLVKTRAKIKELD